MPKLLVIDDEPNITFTIAETLGTAELQVLTAGTAREGLELFRREHPDVVLCDVRLPDQSGLDVFDRIHQMDPRVPVVIMTAFAKTETAIEAMRRGAFEYLVKPVDFAALKQVVYRAITVSRLSHVPAIVGEDSDETINAERIIGLSAPMQEVYKTIGRVAPQDATVLILGESGTGKELVARAIYHYSQRSQNPFLAVNCAALPESLLESELFGHEKGAFTGADQRRIGKFEQVNGGTIFLDEIGDMSPATQAKALRLVQQQEFERIGGNTTIHTNVRIIAATNQDLATMVADGKFRQDLFYRLNGFTIRLPALRERREDIPMLLNHFVKVYNRDLGKGIRSFTPETLAILESHDWPGNVREFQSAVKFAMVHATTDVLTPDCLPESCRERSGGEASPTSGVLPPLEVSWTLGEMSASGAVADSSGLNVVELTRRLLAEGQRDLYRDLLFAIDRAIMEETMRHFDGNQYQAAERLGISRMTLRNKLRSLGMLADKKGSPDDQP
jgi:two-component system nitrogen regulation response regulator GlnG